MALAEQTQAIIDQKTVRAPFAGRLGLRRVSVGGYLAAGEAAVTLQSLDPVFVDFNFPEQHLPDVHVGQTLDFTIKAFPDHVFNATVTALDARVSTKTRNIAVRALAPNPEQLLLPGMFADVKLSLGTDEPRCKQGAGCPAPRCHQRRPAEWLGSGGRGYRSQRHDCHQWPEQAAERHARQDRQSRKERPNTR